MSNQQATSPFGDNITNALASSGGNAGFGGLFDAVEVDEPAPTLYMGCLPKSQDDNAPERKFIRGICPDCGGLVVSNTYLHNGILSFTHECWNSVKPTPTCAYFTIP